MSGNLPATSAGPAKAGELVPALKAETAKELVINSDIVSVCATALPHGVDAGRWWRAFRTYLNKTPGLIECTVDSLYQSLMEVAQCGLTIGGTLGEVYIVPFRDNKSKRPCVVATVVYGYKGLITLVNNETAIVIRGKEVYAGDHFEYREGTDYFIDHRPTLDPKPGEIVAAYALAIYPDGRKDQEVMPRWMLDKAKANSRGASSAGSAYATWDEMMRRKAPIRRLCSRLPKATKAREAISREDARLEALGFYGVQQQAPIAMPRELPRELPAETQGPPPDEEPDRPEEAAQTTPTLVTLAEWVKKGTNKNGEWDLFRIEFSDGAICATFSSTHHATAEQARHAKLPVVYTTSPGKQPGQLNLESIEIVKPPVTAAVTAPEPGPEDGKAE